MLYNLDQTDMYGIAFGLIKLGWLHLGLGGSLLLKEPTDGAIAYTSPNAVVIAATLGLTVPIFSWVRESSMSA